MIRESILITRIIPGEDGNLKIGQMEEFTDSKAYVDFYKAAAEKRASEAA
jgi:hypothetical protein